MNYEKHRVLFGVALLTLFFIGVGCDRGGAHRDVVANVAVSLPVGKGDCVPFEKVSKVIFEPKCKSCHGDGSPNKNWLDHSVASQFTSNLLDKVSNNPPKMGGAAMPMGGALSADEVALLKSWVDGGAKKVCAMSSDPVTPPVTPPADPQPAPGGIANSCTGCHGMNGGGLTDDFPNLAGLSVQYLEKQLKDFRTQDRVDPIMNGFAQNLKDDEITKLAEHFSRLTAVEPAPGNALPAPADVAVCTSCHGATGMADAAAMPGVPNLAGQKATYLLKQLKSFKSSSRKDATMSAFAGMLTEEQMGTIANYFSRISSLKPAGPATSSSGN